MALSNHERVGKALDLLKEGLRPFVERELKAQHAQRWLEQAKASVSDSQANLFGTEAEPRWDVAALLSVMWNQWQIVFRKTLGQTERTLVSELREVRNRWAHQTPFSTDDAYRALDSLGRLLTAISAPQADEIEKTKMELLRVRFDEQVRSEKRRSAGIAIESQVSGHLPPWRIASSSSLRTRPGYRISTRRPGVIWRGNRSCSKKRCSTYRRTRCGGPRPRKTPLMAQ